MMDNSRTTHSIINVFFGLTNYISNGVISLTSQDSSTITFEQVCIESCSSVHQYGAFEIIVQNSDVSISKIVLISNCAKDTTQFGCGGDSKFRISNALVSSLILSKDDIVQAKSKPPIPSPTRTSALRSQRNSLPPNDLSPKTSRRAHF